MTNEEPIGIIYPPPELRGIVESTAKYVAKNGFAFEERIKREHRDKPKFSFLFSDDPFNAYYLHKVKEHRQSLIENIETKTDDTQNQVTQSNDVKRQESISDTREQDTRVKDERVGSLSGDISNRDQDDDESYPKDRPAVGEKLSEYLQEMNRKLEEPPPLNYLATPGPYLTQMDCDIIKLTAQYIATYGRKFLLDIVSREHDNSQFDFLKPQHGQFPYLTNLVMQYALVQNQSLDILEQLEKDSSSQNHVIEKIKMRADWEKMLELERKKKVEAEEKEKLLYSQIDWHDFVIVETIDFQPGEKGKYPPTTADLVGTRLLLQQRYEEQDAPEEMELDSDGPSDDDDDQPSSAQDEKFLVPDAIAPRTGKVVVRKDYDPKASAVKANIDPVNYFVSPITHERVPVDKIHEHMRYNLSDPKYLEKKDQMLKDKMNEEAVFASGSQIQDSLKSLAERRTDIFGTNETETAIGHRIGEEEEETPKDDRMIWDGHKSSLRKKKT